MGGMRNYCKTQDDKSEGKIPLWRPMGGEEIYSK
jgi:hypothetical protein